MAIVRLSGPASLSIVSRLVRRPADKRAEGQSSHLGAWQSHHMYWGRVYDGAGQPLDEVLAVYMKAPHSYTGEDTAEIQGHGGIVLPQLIVQRCVQLGARLATPGEYTMRAFLHGKLDLSQSEAVLGLIQASSQAEVLLNAQGLGGALSRRVQKLRSELLDLVARLEAEIDFGEEVEGLSEVEQLQRVRQVRQGLAQLLENARCGDTLAHGVAVALCGPPNAGKSTLWNSLLGEERALVTPVPGTTRDRLEATCTLKGAYLRLVDTAGLRHSEDYVEQLGIERSRAAIAQADLNLVVLDGSQPWNDELEELAALVRERPCLVVLNKRDLGQRLSGEQVAARFGVATPAVLAVSLLNEADLAPLQEALVAQVRRLVGNTEGAVCVNQRQAQALDRAGECLWRYEQGVNAQMPSDCLLSDLHLALSRLGDVTGDNVGEDIVSAVFAKFCLGK